VKSILSFDGPIRNRALIPARLLRSLIDEVSREKD